MKARSYLILCVVVSVLLPLAILFVPGLSDAIETIMLGFLATAAG